MDAIIVFLVIGLIAGIVGSLIGLGGGVIIVPALLYLSPYVLERGLTTAEAVGTSLVVLIFTALSSSLTFIRQKRVDYRSGLLFFVASGPGAIFGATLTGRLPPGPFYIAFGLFMLLTSMLIVFRERFKPIGKKWKYERTYTDPSGQVHHFGYSLLPALLLGAAVGIVSGMFGIGGGSLFVPMLIALFRYPPHVATATSMFVILLSSVPGAAVKIALGEVYGLGIAGLAPGALLGGWLGAKIAGKLSSPALMRVLLFAFLLLALRMIWQGLS